LQLEVEIPAGLPARFLADPSGGRWVLDGGFDRVDGLERGTIARHDAEHYGVDLKARTIACAHNRFQAPVRLQWCDDCGAYRDPEDPDWAWHTCALCVQGGTTA